MSIATNTNEAPAIVEENSLWSKICGKALPLSLLICGVLLCLSAFAIPGSKHVQSTVVASSKPFSIEEVQLGWRVVGENPLGKETWDAEPNEATWKKVVLHLQSEAGALIEIEFLRPNAWFEKWRAEVGQTIDLALSEPGKSGVAEVVRVERCPEIRAGKGPVVTGLYRHLCEAGELVRVEVDADVEPIVSTYNHRFWSATRQDFIEAADLQSGEQLTCTDETLVSVKRVTAVDGAKPVFNLETHNHHVYAVGVNGMLVHNMHGEDVGGDGEIVRRFNTKSKTKDLKKNGMKFDPDKGDGIPSTRDTIDPVNPDKIIELTGARNADTFADIDISGLPVLRTTTNNGNIEIRIKADIEPARVLGTGRVRRNNNSPDGD